MNSFPKVKTFKEHLKPGGQKRILALDGGGIRGALSLGFLKRIEDILRKQHGNDPGFRLCHYFDLIGGTSTGSIIASALAIGMSVDEIKDLYMDLGGKIFGKKRPWWNPQILKAKFDFSELQSALQKAFGNRTLGSDTIQTGLCIVAKRADTNSTWPLINHPKGVYYKYNKNILLWQAIRASTAAPTYFMPQAVDVGNGEKGIFIDGGVSMANNPALTLLMVATLKGFPFKWPMGEDKLFMVSVGTGHGEFRKLTTDFDDAWLTTWAKNIPDMLMQDANYQNQIMLQWLSNSPTAMEIDSEMLDLKGDYLAGQPQLRYLRYDFTITENDLNGLQLGRTFNAADVVNLLEMSNAHNRELLYQIGLIVAKRNVKNAHFMPT